MSDVLLHPEAFIGLAVLALLIGAIRNTSWGLLLLWLVAVVTWLFASNVFGWLLLMACLTAACLMPRRKAKP